MSYIERIRGPQQTATVVPINGTRREHADGVHPYAAAIRSAWLDRLDALASKSWQQGDAWDTNCFVTARKLIELANSPWSGYALGDARSDYLSHAPRNSAWDQREKCWNQASDVASGVMLPEPPPGDKWDVPNATVIDEAFLAAAEGRQAEGEPDIGELVRERFPLLDFVHLMSTEDEGQEWLVEPILPARRLVALYSAPKVGKSLLMLEIAVGVALGLPVLGTTPEARNVLYVDFENDPRGDIKLRLEAMGYGAEDGERLNAGLKYMSFPTLAKLDTPQGGFEILATAQEHDCELVVIDTVSRAVGGEENDNDTWLAFYRNTGMLLKGAGIACIRLDHSGKDAEKGMRGGSAKYGDVDAVWKLTTETPGGTTLDLVCTDHRMPIEEDRLFLIRETQPTLHHRVIGDRSMALDARENEIDRAIDKLNLPDGTAANEIYRRLKDSGNGYAKAAVLRVIKARKMRLSLPDHIGSGTAPEPPGTAAGPGGSRSPLRSRAPEPPAVDRFPEPEPEPNRPMFVVACRSCYTPIQRADADANGGMCPKCSARAGVVE